MKRQKKSHGVLLIMVSLPQLKAVDRLSAFASRIHERVGDTRFCFSLVRYLNQAKQCLLSI